MNKSLVNRWKSVKNNVVVTPEPDDVIHNKPSTLIKIVNLTKEKGE